MGKPDHQEDGQVEFPRLPAVHSVLCREHARRGRGHHLAHLLTVAQWALTHFLERPKAVGEKYSRKRCVSLLLDKLMAVFFLI